MRESAEFAISPAMQVKLLHVLQQRRFQRVGGEHDIEVDVRIVAATNMDLGRLSDQGLFRKDLYCHLTVFPIEAPPVRERREDIPLLVDLLFERLCAAHGEDTLGLHPAVMKAFMSYDWPGNVREMENLLERAVILKTGRRLLPEGFPDDLLKNRTIGGIPVDTGKPWRRSALRRLSRPSACTSGNSWRFTTGGSDPPRGPPTSRPASCTV